MPKKTLVLRSDVAGRMRITVELCGDSESALQAVLDILNQHGKQVSISQVVRAALIHYERTGHLPLARHALIVRRKEM